MVLLQRRSSLRSEAESSCPREQRVLAGLGRGWAATAGRGARPPCSPGTAGCRRCGGTALAKRVCLAMLRPDSAHRLVLERGLAGLLHAAGPREVGMYLGLVELRAQQCPWSGTAAVPAPVAVRSPGEAARDGDVQRAGDAQDAAGVQLLEVTRSLLQSPTPVPAGACLLLGAWGWMSHPVHAGGPAAGPVG